MNYDLLKLICEKNLLDEIASEIHEKAKIENCKFEISQPEAEINVEVLNFFKVKNCKLDRELNESLQDYDLKNNKQTFTYVK